MNCKAKGNRLERKTISRLEAAGYLCVRSAASLGPFDIVAANRLGFRVIQVKSNCWPGPIERESMREAAKNLPPNTTVECWRWNDRSREPLIKLIEEFNN